MPSLETGVDKLVNLVAKEKKIEMEDAAKRLGVDQAVVREWAEFLEDEGIVSLQFSLSKTFVVEKRLSKTEVVKKEKEYENRKEAFVRRVDSALKQLEDETAGFEVIKKHYDAVKQQIGDEIDAVKEEMEQLRHYEELKHSIDSDILNQKVQYQKKLDEVRAAIKTEERRYEKLVKDVEDETKKITQESAEFGDLKREESDLMKRIDALQEIIKRVRGRITSHSQTIAAHEQRFMTLRDLAEKLRADIVDKRKKELEPMLKISDDQANKILRIQEDIVGKVKGNRDKMKEFEQQSKEIADQFGKFFERRSRVEETIKGLEHAKIEMKEELTELIRKAKAFEIANKNADMNQHIRELEGKFHEFDRRKGAFSKQLEYLKNFITGKTDAPPPSVKLAATPAKAPAAKKSSAPKKPSGNKKPAKKKK